MDSMTIRVDLLKSTSGLLMAVSPDLRGLCVHGETLEELDERIPAGIKSILECMHSDRTVVVDEAVGDHAGFSPVAPRTFNAEFRAAA